MSRSRDLEAPVADAPGHAAAQAAPGVLRGSAAILALQRTAGNAAVTRALQRQANEWFGPSWTGGGQGESGGGAVSGPAPPPDRDPTQLPSWLEPEPPAGEPGEPPRTPEAGIFFPVDVDRLDAGDKRVLSELAERLKEDLASNRVRIRIRGFADKRAGDEYNLDLSQRRADAVEDFLRQELQRNPLGGVPSGAHPDLSSETVGLGEEASTDTPEDLAQRRRVEIYVERWPKDPGREPEEQPHKAPGTRFRAKITGGRSAGGGPLQIEVIGLRIESLETGDGMEFTYWGAGASLGPPVGFGVNSESSWVEFETSAPVRPEDFTGPASHGSVVVTQPGPPGQPGVAGDEFKLNYGWFDENGVNHDEVNVVFTDWGGAQWATPGAGMTTGYLEQMTLE